VEGPSAGRGTTVRVIVIGAGVGGLAAAARLAAQGHDVALHERAATHGGKLGVRVRDGFVFDTGPSLLTLPDVVHETFAATGGPAPLDIEPVDPVCSYRFADGTRLDLPFDDAAIPAALDAALGAGAGERWSALHARLEAYASLPAPHWPRAARAAELLASLFPDGLSFLSLPYSDEWAEGEKRLERIALGGLARDLDELAGMEFLAEVKRAQQRYGEVLALRKGSDRKLPGDLTDPLRALGRAVSNYALQVIATNDGSAASIHSIRQTLKPIDDMRSAVSSRRVAAGRDDPI